MKKILCIALACVVMACTPTQMAEVRSAEKVVASSAELACQDAIALGVNDNTLVAVCNGVETLAPLVASVLAARANPAPAKARLAAHMANRKVSDIANDPYEFPSE